ncbi:hypothetical protein Golob_025204 [Gossypium lobatum]|uniref:Secreted protein n=1 Tax=Gossypium lobatum TaxID=34289 RepID=A0A7J8NJP8_9ROSI|nr:hypothetical protein [Gossypium lobatum]
MRKLLNTRLELLLLLVWLRPLMWSSHLATPDLTLHRPLSPRCSTLPPRLTRVLSKLSLRLSLSRRVTKLVLHSEAALLAKLGIRPFSYGRLSCLFMTMGQSLAPWCLT